MTKEYDELLKSVAQQIYVARNGEIRYVQYMSDPRIREAYEKDAKAAIRAIQDWMPDKFEGDQIIERCNAYNEFKTMGRNDEKQ